MKKITELEAKVLRNIASSEYMNADGEQIIGFPVWSFSATNQKKDLAGALGSLVKKGFCNCDQTESDPTCCMTKEGYEVYKEIAKPKA